MLCVTGQHELPPRKLVLAVPEVEPPDRQVAQFFHASVTGGLVGGQCPESNNFTPKNQSLSPKWS